LDEAQCPLLALSGHLDRLRKCPLLGVKRTFLTCSLMSAFDPKRTLGVSRLIRKEAVSLQRVLVDLAVFHDQSDGFNAFFPGFGVEILIVCTKDSDIFQRVAVDDENVRIGTWLDNP